MRKFVARCLARLDKRTIALVDYGATSIFLTEHAPVVNIVNNTQPIRVGAAAGPPITSTTTCELALLSELSSDFPLKGHDMKGFHENLVGIGPICDAKYSVLFNDELVTIISPTGIPVLKGWREATGNWLWRMSLLPNADKVTTVEASPGVTTTTLKAYSAYDLPSVEALVRYFHAATGYPVKDVWLKAIKAGNYLSWRFAESNLATMNNYLP